MYAALFTPDGDRVVTAGGDGLVRIARAFDGGPVRELARPRRLGAPLRYYQISVAGDTVVAIDTAGAVVDVWDARDGALLTELDAAAAVDLEVQDWAFEAFETAIARGSTR